MSWIWTDEKNLGNKLNHGVSFETATLVFKAPLAATRFDPHPDGDRWQTVGLIGALALFVVHAWPEPHAETGEEVGRIISARKATKHERRAYE